MDKEQEKQIKEINKMFLKMSYKEREAFIWCLKNIELIKKITYDVIIPEDELKKMLCDAIERKDYIAGFILAIKQQYQTK